MKGLFAVFRKEFRDHFSSNRFVILFALIAMVSFITCYMAGLHLKENLEGLAKTKFPFLMLFSTPGALFSMVQFVAFFGPLIGLVLGFDSINRERAHGTLIKVISHKGYGSPLRIALFHDEQYIQRVIRFHSRSPQLFAFITFSSNLLPV